MCSRRFVETFAAVPGPTVSLKRGPVVATVYGAVNTFVASGTNPTAGTDVATTLVTITPAVRRDSPGDGDPGEGDGHRERYPGDVSRSRLHRADIAAMVIGGLGMVAIGFVIVISPRRRKASAPKWRIADARTAQTRKGVIAEPFLDASMCVGLPPASSPFVLLRSGRANLTPIAPTRHTYLGRSMPMPRNRP